MMTIRFTDRTNGENDPLPGDDAKSARETGDGISVPAPAGTTASIAAAAIAADIAPWNGALADNAVGWTMYDLPTSADGTITVLLPQAAIRSVPAQSLVRIVSRDDAGDRTYLGIVTAGPFAEPDGLRADANLIVTTTVLSKPFQPRYHGRVQVELLGEERSGVLQPPRFRPLPNSAVSVLDDAETARVLSVGGSLRLGLAVGHIGVEVGVPADKKGVLPRHTGIVGTTGGGKSTTVAGLIGQAQRENLAVILLDVEGEYTHLHEPTTDPTMTHLLTAQGRQPEGVPSTTLYSLVGRETTNDGHPNRQMFTLRYSDISPYAVIEILELSEAQQERYFAAYDIAIRLVGKLQIAQVNRLELDEFETGCPGVTLQLMMDVVGAVVSKLGEQDPSPGHPALRADPGLRDLKRAVAELKTSHPTSWRTLLARLGRLARMRVFDNERDGAHYLDPHNLLRPGAVSIIDLSDTDGTDLRNVVIADLLRRIQTAQEDVYNDFEKARVNGSAEPPRTLVIIEEAHEFLAKNRVAQMPNLFQQVERIAKRGRKRWLGLVFVTQLPQHLAPQVFALINNWIIHKISDPAALSDLRQAVSGIDDSLWKQVRGLAPGQAVLAFGHMTRPVLTAIDPAPAQLRMVD